MNTNSVSTRLARVMRFDVPVYREIAADQTATGQAALVVMAAAIIAAIGRVGLGPTAVIVAAVVSIIGFVIYVAVATVVSQAFFQGKTNFSEMGRTLGIAYAWYALGILGIIPLLGGLLAFLGWIAAVIAGVIALRESSEFDTLKALVTVVIAAIVAAFINGVLQRLLTRLF